MRQPLQHKVLGHGASIPPGAIDDRVDHVNDHHEYRDLNFKSVVQFIIGLVAIVAISYISMYGMMKVFESQKAKNDPGVSPLATPEWTPPPVDVQMAPHVDLVNDRARQDSILRGLSTNGPTMSIDQAMKEVVSEGLPVRSSVNDTSGAAERASGASEDAANAAADTAR